MNNKTKVLASILLTSTITIGGTVGIYNEKLDVKETKIVKMQEKMELKNSEIANLEDSVKSKNEKIKDYKGKNDSLIKKNKSYSNEIDKLKKENKKLKSEYSYLNNKYKYNIHKVSSNNSNFNKSDGGSDATVIKEMTVNTSAYIALCREGCSGKTTSGYDVRNTIYYNGMRIIATDTSVIPMYSIVEIEGFSGKFIALDTGGAIKGNKIDVLVSTESEANMIGRHDRKLKVLRYGK